MAQANEQFAFPFGLGRDGHIATVEQDSDAEIAACMAVTLLWPKGSRELDLDFGLDDQTGLQGGANLDEVRQALAHGEPRATEAIVQDDDALADFVSRVTVNWSRAQAQTP